MALEEEAPVACRTGRVPSRRAPRGCRRPRFSGDVVRDVHSLWKVVAVMTSMRALDDAKRGHPTRVGPLAKLILRHKMQTVVVFTAEERAKMRALLLTSDDRMSEIVGEQVSILRGLDSLTAGQMTLLRAKVLR